MEYKIQYKFSILPLVLHWTLRSAEFIERPYTFTGKTVVHRAHWLDNTGQVPWCSRERASLSLSLSLSLETNRK